MRIGEVKKWAKRAPWRMMAEILTIFAKRLYTYRLSSNGFVSGDVYEPTLMIPGMTTSTQIVNEVINEAGCHVGFALKQRDQKEKGDAWKGLFHSPCTTGRQGDTPEKQLGRNTKDVFGKELPREKLAFLGVTIHDEPERLCSCTTIMFLRQVSAGQIKSFRGVWEIFTDIHNPKIIDHNQQLLGWVLDPNRHIFEDIRSRPVVK